MLAWEAVVVEFVLYSSLLPDDAPAGSLIGQVGSPEKTKIEISVTLNSPIKVATIRDSENPVIPP